MSTTIQISDNIKETLQRMKLFEKETYNDVIERMIEDSMQINDRTKKEIEQARKRVQAGKFVTMDAVAKKFGV